MRTSAESLAAQARRAMRAKGYDRQGGKGNRCLQMERATTVCDWVQRHCQVHKLGSLGARQVTKFWIAHPYMAQSTAYGYWLALCHLWRCADKAGKPPRALISPDLIDPEKAEVVSENKI